MSEKHLRTFPVHSKKRSLSKEENPLKKKFKIWIIYCLEIRLRADGTDQTVNRLGASIFRLGNLLNGQRGIEKGKGFLFFFHFRLTLVVAVIFYSDGCERVVGIVRIKYNNNNNNHNKKKEPQRNGAFRNKILHPVQLTFQ